MARNVGAGSRVAADKGQRRLRSWWAWQRYWQIERRRRRVLPWIARHLPGPLKRAVYVAVAVEALGKMPGDTIVPEVRMTAVMETWGR